MGGIGESLACVDGGSHYLWGYGEKRKKNRHWNLILQLLYGKSLATDNCIPRYFDPF